MNNRIKFFVLTITLTTATLITSAQNQDIKLAAVFNRSQDKILVAAHRGDWRNAPENSLRALLLCIEKGFDIMELDVKMTKDSQMVVMHDNTIDRTTNAKGKVSDYTLLEIQKFRLKNGLGRVTLHPIPTLTEMMLVAKNKILINVDKGNDHLDRVFEILEKTETLSQAIVNVGDNVNYEKLIKEEKIPAKAYIMVVVNMNRVDALSVISGYQSNKRSIIQPIFDTDTLVGLKQIPIIAKQQVVWLNSLWPSLNGGHDDDRAVDLKEEKESWGWLIDKKPLIIQTDRPSELTLYLKKQGL
ncbi:glycerophosphodiester phosphodiesterase family protein [Pedobacter mucosus]|uniref:glycerophosphodiester phosphodiesterase family protein n=1 Tax=Pedobacter mucosus TaxID=2895286 RepID=UPI001EE4C743|nr:glycerophosphodiester phosphodiesterase family protein [Pedobacter mucosus]UKT64650.1 glycerophosphodiester phosphodiesterase family protein [Pedobacter mucosus]